MSKLYNLLINIFIIQIESHSKLNSKICRNEQLLVIWLCAWHEIHCHRTRGQPNIFTHCKDTLSRHWLLTYTIKLSTICYLFKYRIILVKLEKQQPPCNHIICMAWSKGNLFHLPPIARVTALVSIFPSQSHPVRTRGPTHPPFWPSSWYVLPFAVSKDYLFD